jgi:2-polyprenyl-3-methyl-5-hydroxy-6-metoxy-1,4-benzoquinol methylase
MSKQDEIDYVKNTGGLERVWLNEKPFRGANPRESARLLRDLAAVLELLDLPEEARVLDVGCGPGWTSVFLARMGYHVTGFDLAPDMITLAGRRAAREGVTANCTFQVADSEAFELAPEFDAVLVYDTLHHVQNEAAVLENCLRALKPGGTLVLAEPGALHGRRARGVTVELGVTERGFSPRDLKRTLRRVGFTDIRHYVPASRAYMDSSLAALKTALYDLLYFFALKETHLQVWLVARK